MSHCPGDWNAENFNVLDDGRELGCIYRINAATEIWWGVSFQLTGRKSYGRVDTRRRRWPHSGRSVSIGARSNRKPDDDDRPICDTVGKPWESMRGPWTTDYNNVDALADRTERRERDVLGRDIVLGEQGEAFVFRLHGHTWRSAPYPVGIVVIETNAGVAVVIASRYWSGGSVAEWLGPRS